MKETLFTICGIVGGAVAGFFGGWNSAMTALLICMGVDYVTGIAQAIMCKSKKSKTGGLSSRAGMKGLIKKGVVIMIVLVAAQMDVVVGTKYIRDAVCIGFILNEILSIVENAGMIGIPMPAAFKKAIDILKQKEDEGRK